MREKHDTLAACQSLSITPHGKRFREEGADEVVAGNNKTKQNKNHTSSILVRLAILRSL